MCRLEGPGFSCLCLAGNEDMKGNCHIFVDLLGATIEDPFLHSLLTEPCDWFCIVHGAAGCVLQKWEFFLEPSPMKRTLYLSSQLSSLKFSIQIIIMCYFGGRKSV